MSSPSTRQPDLSAVALWGAPWYVERGSGLPHMGDGPLGPRPLEPSDVDAVMGCTDAAALAELKAYARSYFAVSGSIVAGVTVAAAATLARRPALAAIAVFGAGAAGMIVLEARRRARQWEAVADARLALLADA